MNTKILIVALIALLCVGCNDASGVLAEKWAIVKSGDCYAYSLNGHVFYGDCWGSYDEALSDMTAFREFRSKKKFSKEREWIAVDT